MDEIPWKSCHVRGDPQIGMMQQLVQHHFHKNRRLQRENRQLSKFESQLMDEIQLLLSEIGTMLDVSSRRLATLARLRRMEESLAYKCDGKLKFPTKKRPSSTKV